MPIPEERSCPLSERASRKVQLEVPKRGDRKKLLDQARRNAEEALDRRLAETTTQGKILRELADTFELADVPKRIEVYDNSHIMGTNATGAMIVAGPEGFRKNSYRKFNIKNPETRPGDDEGPEPPRETFTTAMFAPNMR